MVLLLSCVRQILHVFKPLLTDLSCHLGKSFVELYGVLTVSTLKIGKWSNKSQTRMAFPSKLNFAGKTFFFILYQLVVRGYEITIGVESSWEYGMKCFPVLQYRLVMFSM
jgi:hypothetical protein